MRGACLVLLLCALALTGCGDDGGAADRPPPPSPEELRSELRDVTQSTAADFPAPGGKTLNQLGEGVLAGPEIALATSVFTRGENRLAFGIIDPDGQFVYGKTAIYVAASPDKPAKGPYPAPADLLVTDEEFASETAATPEDLFAAVYQTQVPLRRTGTVSILSLTRNKQGLIGAGTQIKVLDPADSKVPDVGDPAPEVETDTVFESGGDIAAIDTRVPPDDMHDVGFEEVLGKRPVALLFATPALCESRVCGPVVDIAAQVKETYGDRMEFIHQEVYVDNNASKGLREPLKAFRLATEPWLFVVNKEGRIAARLEGSFGVEAFERAVKAGLD